MKFGWLRQLGSFDFAGGTAVHISSGVSSMVANVLLPPRENVPVKPENVFYVILGASLLWFGWFGFNSGSALAGTGLAAQAFITTQTAASTGFITWGILDLIIKKELQPVGAACGAVIGLVAITPAAGFVHTPSAIAFGIFPVVVIYFWLILRKNYLNKIFKTEDTLDVFAAHGMGGILGCLMLAFFASADINSSIPNGIFFGGDGYLLAYQITAIVSVSAYSVVVTFLILLFLRFTFGLTYDKENLSQIDLFQHGTLIKKPSVVNVVEMPKISKNSSLGIDVTNPSEENGHVKDKDSDESNV
jgi:Amt family ammonium transporter